MGRQHGVATRDYCNELQQQAHYLCCQFKTVFIVLWQRLFSRRRGCRTCTPTLCRTSNDCDTKALAALARETYGFHRTTRLCWMTCNHKRKPSWILRLCILPVRIPSPCVNHHKRVVRHFFRMSTKSNLYLLPHQLRRVLSEGFPGSSYLFILSS